MDFAEREKILEASPGVGKVRHRRTHTYHVPGPPLPPADRLRHYYVNERDYEGQRYEGHGLTPEAVVNHIVEGFAAFDDSHEPCDFCVWENDLVAAVVHSRGDGSADVTRIEWPEMVATPVVPVPPDRPRFAKEGVWTVESSASVLHQTRRSEETLESLVADLVNGRHYEDMAVWKDSQIVAYVQAMPDRTARVTIVPSAGGCDHAEAG